MSSTPGKRLALLEREGSLVRHLRSSSPAASALAKRSLDTCSASLSASSCHDSSASRLANGISGSSKTPGKARLPPRMARLALPADSVMRKSSVAPLMPGSPGVGIAPAATAAGRACKLSWLTRPRSSYLPMVSAGPCQETRRCSSTPLGAWRSSARRIRVPNGSWLAIWVRAARSSRSATSSPCSARDASAS